MKKLILSSFILLVSLAHGQSYTTVTATVQDSNGQVWANLTVIATFIPPPSGVGKPTNGGLPIIDTPQTVVGDGSGAFTLTLDDNSKVQPAGSRWSFSICSNTSAQCSTLIMAVSGPAMDISGQIGSILITPVVNGAPTMARAYNVVNEPTGGNGAVVVKTSDNTLWMCQTVPGSTCPPGWTQVNSNYVLPANILKWQGVWNALNNYIVQDVVFYNFSAWVALVNNTASTPAIGNANWQATTSVGTDKQVIFNDGGNFSGDANFVYDKVAQSLTVSNNIISKQFSSNGVGGLSIQANEGNNTCTPSTSVDCLWSDITNHRWMMNNNNVGNLKLVGIASAGTSGHVATLTANGLDIQDGGVLPTGTVTGSGTTGNLAQWTSSTAIGNGPSGTAISNAITGDYVQSTTLSACGATCTYNFSHTFTTIHSCVCSGEGGSCNVASKSTSQCVINTTVGTNDVTVSGVY